MTLMYAGIIAILVGLIHSVLGEYLIFRHLREGGIVPTLSAPPLRQRHIRILWASWHIVSLFGFAFAAILIWLCFNDDDALLKGFVIQTIAMTMLASSVLVFLATKARHPGWLGLLAVAILTWYS